MLRRSADAPIISLPEALQALHGQGDAWTPGQQYDGKIVKLMAAYGLVDLGYLDSKGAYYGSRNIRLKTCDSSGKCSDSDTVLDKVENRPMWVLDFSNATMQVLAPPADNSQPVACTPAPDFNHSLYVIDAATRTYVIARFYYGA